MDKPNLDDTIRLGRRYVMEHIDEGVKCPLCSQRAQRYHRKLNSGMIVGLIKQWKHPQGGFDYVHTRSIWMPWTKEGAQLQWWGFIEPLPEKREDGGKVGIWRVTKKGAYFINGELEVFSHAVVYDGKLRGFEGEMLSVTEALGSKFNYNELMARV